MGVKENKPGPPVDRNRRVTGTHSTAKKQAESKARAPAEQGALRL